MRVLQPDKGNRPLKLLAMCDTPTRFTGFAKVAHNLLPRWHKQNGGIFEEIDVWGINYHGERYDRAKHLYGHIYSAHTGQSAWATPVDLGRFIMELDNGANGYTHLWIMQDSFNLSTGDFSEHMKRVTDARGIRTVYYAPVDAPWQEALLDANGRALVSSWGKLVNFVDQTVAYTEYGKHEIVRVMDRKFNPEAILVLPHGTDQKIFEPKANRPELRAGIVKEWPAMKPQDILMLNVNTNSKRKDPARSLMLLKELNRGTEHNGHPLPNGGRHRLLVHMQYRDSEGSDLRAWAAQLGLKEREDWFCTDSLFMAGFALAEESGIANLYNAADLTISTTLGEGWGFSMTEAVCCGCPIAMPLHTSCREIMAMLGREGMTEGIIGLPLENYPVAHGLDTSRLRWPVSVSGAAAAIAGWAKDRQRPKLTPAIAEWLNWDRIAKEWLKLF